MQVRRQLLTGGIAVTADLNNDGVTDPNELREIRVRRDSPVQGARDAFLELKNRLCSQIRSEIEDGSDLWHPSRLRPYVHDRLSALLEQQGIIVNRSEKRQLLEAIVADLINSQK